MAIVGRSGSGKTTPLSMPAGIDRPTSGTIRAAGADLDSLSESAPLPFRISAPAVAIWIVLVVLGAALATEAAASRASRVPVREALAYL